MIFSTLAILATKDTFPIVATSEARHQSPKEQRDHKESKRGGANLNVPLLAEPPLFPKFLPNTAKFFN